MPTTRLRRGLTALVLTLLATGGLQAALTTPAHAGQVGVTIGVAGAGRVAVVEGSLEDGGSRSCDWTSNQDHRVTHWCERVRDAEAFEAWVWLRALPATTPYGQWLFDGWSGCDSTRVRDGFTECAVHSGAFSSDERRPVARFRDAVAPSVTSLTAAQVPGADRRFRFTFGVDHGATECRVQGDATGFVPCTSPVETVLPQGDRRFLVRGVDPSGNTGEAGVDVASVDTFLVPWVSNPDRTRTADFMFDSHPRADLHCSLDWSAWTACGSLGSGSIRYTDLADGSHTFRVRGRVGTWEDPLPATYTWTVDATAPETQLTPTVGAGSVSFAFTAPGASAYECRLGRPSGPGTWAACASPVAYDGLGDGSHTFEVRARDLAGNVETTPAVHQWRVDRTAPETTLDGPSGFVLSDAAELALGSEPGASFACTLDEAVRPCVGPALALAGLAAGTHVVTAAATDAAGNTDPTPASRTWTVPLVARDLGHDRSWTTRRSSTAYGGAYLQATRRGATLTRRVTGATGLALVVGRGRGHGTVEVRAGSRRLATVRLAATRTRSRQLVQVTDFDVPYTGPVRVVVTTSGRTVRVEGLGVATR